MKKSILLLPLLVLLITSCKKNNKPTDAIKNNCLLAESSYKLKLNAGSGLTQYTYDQQGRVTTVKYNGTLDQYVYSNDQILLKKNSGLIVTYKLDAAGRIIRESYSDHPDKIDFIYNAEGYLIQSAETLGNYTFVTKYAYTNGNLSTVEDRRGILNIFYNNDAAANNFIDDHGDENELPAHYNGPLKYYFGKTSKNLISKIADNHGYTEEYIYQKDTRGNIAALQVNASNGKGYVLQLKYNCD
ncbi:DUF4595 domain-containing protein [Pedobacter nutrimenti]|jgi:hypothetical protein|uniref:YD repeat-containing protein n=1 Tax=Pedobacter nutrimenti TaxID=1241337 RepID=A0A318UD09_9SPHI|nr:DUF4595 domain-containing protein [Pedobacter nutrimenti]PYF74322.1 YD repeat-containing protein [Pedobacter nutrimenti]